jgi:hypothetical protein
LKEETAAQTATITFFISAMGKRVRDLIKRSLAFSNAAGDAKSSIKCLQSAVIIAFRDLASLMSRNSSERSNSLDTHFMRALPALPPPPLASPPPRVAAARGSCARFCTDTRSLSSPNELHTASMISWLRSAGGEMREAEEAAGDSTAGDRGDGCAQHSVTFLLLLLLLLLPTAPLDIPAILSKVTFPVCVPRRMVRTTWEPASPLMAAATCRMLMP